MEEEEISILPFPVLPIVSKQSGEWRCKQAKTLNLLLDRLSSSQIYVIKRSIGDGIQKTFSFDLPFEKLLSWRIVSPLHGVVQPDCHLTTDKLIIVFGVPPAIDEFEVEIIGICRRQTT
jgi:hypothetical protein